jgi:purine-binding chemotaxis protein CheW
MSAQRFRAEKDYFGKRSRLPEELIGAGETAFTGGSQDAIVVSENIRDAEAEDTDRKLLKADRHTYLIFRLRGQEYALETPNVTEIMRRMKINSIPRAPGYMKGVVNLRDRIIPVVDLGLKLGMEEIELTEQTCIIVVEVTGSKGPMAFGILVDNVSEVIKISADQIQKTPIFGAGADTSYISGIAILEGGINILIDIEKAIGTIEHIHFSKWDDLHA